MASRGEKELFCPFIQNITNNTCISRQFCCKRLLASHIQSSLHSKLCALIIPQVAMLMYTNLLGVAAANRLSSTNLMQQYTHVREYVMFFPCMCQMMRMEMGVEAGPLSENGAFVCGRYYQLFFSRY